MFFFLCIQACFINNDECMIQKKIEESNKTIKYVGIEKGAERGEMSTTKVDEEEVFNTQLVYLNLLAKGETACSARSNNATLVSFYFYFPFHSFGQ